MTLGAALKKARTMLGLTLQEVSKSASLSTTALSQIENDKAKPQFKTLRRLCNVLQINPAILLEKYY